MPFPPVQSRTTSVDTTATTAARTHSFPATMNVGDLLIAILCCQGIIGQTDPTGSLPSGWTLLREISSQNTVGSSAYRVVDGTEPANFIWTLQGATGADVNISVATIIRITNAGTPEASVVASNVTNTPNANSLSPSGGSDDYLWITYYQMAGNDGSGTVTYPTNYSQGQTKVVGNDGSGHVCHLASAERELTASAEDAGAFTAPATLRWGCYTISVPYVAAGVSRTLEGFLWRADDGSESGASALASQDVSISRAADTSARLRMLVDMSGDAPAEGLLLQYRRQGATTWRDVPVA